MEHMNNIYLPKRQLRAIRPHARLSSMLLRGLLILFTFFAVLLGTVVLVLDLFCTGPSHAAKSTFVNTILETGEAKFLASWFLTEDEINEVIEQNSLKAMDAQINTSLITVAANREVLSAASKTESGNNTSGTPSGEHGQPDVSDKKQEGGGDIQTQPVDDEPEFDVDAIELVEITGRTFYAKMLIINDPSRITLATTYPWGTYGKELGELVEDSGAIAGVNGGLYRSYNNTGGRPYGVVVSGGEIQYNDPTAFRGLYLIGFSEDNILRIISLAGMKADDVTALVEEEKIRDAVTFQEESSDINNHFVTLVINGEARELNGYGSGMNPRTAIGQRADGSVLLLVTDGRGISGHIGATAKDLISVMMEYGAVNAANLDGGSSSSMYYKDVYEMSSVTLYYANSSWLLPTAFVVAPR